jgi:solute carrier family 25 protein 34/35
VKTRLQLQGELQTKSQQKIYNNAFSAIANVYRNEGLRGIQRGLMPAYYYQILLNGFRLGMYEPIKGSCQNIVDGLAHQKDYIPLFSMVFAGMSAGVVGAFIANPFFLIKTVVILLK